MAAGSRVTPRSRQLHNIKSAEGETTVTDSRRGLTCNVCFVTDGARGRELTRLLNLSAALTHRRRRTSMSQAYLGMFSRALYYMSAGDGTYRVCDFALQPNASHSSYGVYMDLISEHFKVRFARAFPKRMLSRPFSPEPHAAAQFVSIRLRRANPNVHKWPRYLDNSSFCQQPMWYWFRSHGLMSYFFSADL